MLKTLLFILIALSASTLVSAKCNVNQFIQSPEGQEKLTHILDRTKSLIISKLTDLDIKETDIEIIAQVPKKVSNTDSRDLEVKLKGHDYFHIWGEGIFLKKIRTREIKCGLEITFSGGNLLNKRTGQDFGSLGKVTEFVRIY